MESVTILWIVFYVFIGLLSVQLVRFAGPLAIGGQYTVEELYPSDESGRLNVAYRILAPTICCQLPVFIMAAICDAFSVPGPSLRYMPTLFYWLFLGVIKHARGKLRYRTLPFSFEAFMSLLLSVAFDHFVIDGYLGGQGLDVLDTSSIAFEFELALFGVVTFWISTFLSVIKLCLAVCTHMSFHHMLFRRTPYLVTLQLIRTKPGSSHTSANMVISYLSVFRMISC